MDAAVPVLRSPKLEYVGPPKEMFLDPDWFERDLDAIWRPRWMFAGHIEEISSVGQYITYSLGTDQVLIRKDVDGEVKAFHNVCPHRGARLCQSDAGIMPGRRVVCPYHGWSFSPSDGELMSAPAMHEDFDPRPWGLKPVHVEVWQGLIFVCLAEDRPEPVREQFAGHEELGGYDFSNVKIAAVETTIVDANWKVVTENDRECYHCAINHPELSAVQDWRSYGTASEEFEKIMEDGANGLMDVHTAAVDGRLQTVDNDMVCRIPIGRPDGNPEPGSFSLTWWPGIALGLARDYAKIFSPKPLNPEQTEVRVYWFVNKDAEEGVDYNVDDVKAFFKVTYGQDSDICENVHKGMKSSAYTPGPLNRMYQSGQAGMYAWYMNQMSQRYPDLVNTSAPLD